MSVRRVKKKSVTKKSSLTTSCLLSKSTGGLKAGTCILNDCSQAKKVGLCCASIATLSKQQPSESNGNKHEGSSFDSYLEENKNILPEGVGTKFDTNKPALAYIPKAALYAEGRAFAYGAKKYAAWNYKKGIAITRTLSAAIRHTLQFLDGENMDSESGVNHIGCARANLAMALDTLENHPELDDRYKSIKTCDHDFEPDTLMTTMGCGKCEVEAPKGGKEMTLFAIDIDGTLANATERLKRAGKEPSRKNSKAYKKWVTSVNKGMKDDLPVPGMLSLIKGLGEDKVVYLTSRDASLRKVTQEWLMLHNFPHYGLIMRPTGSHTEGVDFKEIALETLYWSTQATAIVVIDDDGKRDIEKMCKRNGYTFLKARSGGQP